MGNKASLYIINKSFNYLKIYTDGSKNKQGSVGTGVFIPECKISIAKRLSDYLSVYTAELVGVI